MALVLKDRVKEQTTTTGTGTVTLGGAVSGFDTFASVGNGNTTYYAIVSQSANEWEVGIGTYTASGTTLSRDTILESSNSDAAVNFSAGTKDVFVTYPADKSVYADAAGTVNAGAIAATSLTLTTDLAVADGGTGAGTFAANGILFGNGTSAIGATAVGTSGHILTSNGSGVAPTFQAAAAGGATDIDGLSDALTNSSGGTVGLGTGALAADDGSANLNTALGFDALNDVVTGSRNVAVGHSAGSKVTSGNNTFIGERAGQLLVTGSENTAVGSAAMISAVTGNGNSAFGYAALGGGSGTSMGQNVGVGYYAGAAITTGDGNTVVGYDNGATNVLTTGSNNIVLGNLTSASSATVSNEITLGNTSVDKFRIPGINFIIKDSTATEDYVLTVDASGEAGWEAAAAGGATDIDGLSDGFTSGTSALYLGTGVGNSNTATNTAVGELSLQSITGASGGVVAFGWKAGQSNAGGYWNTFIGATAADGVTTGNKNVLMGYDVSKTLTTGSQNVIIGSQAAENLSTGGSNTIIGENAGTATATNANCIIMGQGAASSSNSVANEITLGNTTVDKFRIPGINFIIKDSTATEDYVLTVDASGEAGWEAAAAGGASDIDGLSDGMTSAAGKNLSLGTDALAALGTSDLSSTAVGYKAGEAIATAGRGTFVGHLAGADLNSWSNTVVGAYSAQSHTGGYNTLVGAQVASAAAGLMDANTIVGAGAGDNITTGGNSVIVGYTAGSAITTASNHALVGYHSGNAITTGHFHTALGRQANTTSTTGQQTVVIGYNAQPSSATVSHEITLGNASVTSFRIPGVDFYSLNGDVGIGTAAPSQKLTVEGTDARIYLTGANTDISMSGNADGQLSLDGNGYGFGIALNSSGANLYTNSASRDLIFGTDETERMRIDGSGNVGIGLSAPLTKFVVDQGAVQSPATTGTMNTGMVVQAGTGSAALNIGADADGAWYNAGYSNNPGVARNHRWLTGGTERMHIDSSGNVGIGTASPAKQLSITKSALATINTLTDGATITPDFDAGQNFSVTLAGNRTLANPTNIDAGQTGSIFITQDGTGSRTLSFGSYWDFAGGTAPTLSTAAGAVDRIDYIVRTGTSIHAVATLNLS